MITGCSGVRYPVRDRLKDFGFAQVRYEQSEEQGLRDRRTVLTNESSGACNTIH
jgi:hypothetical protein